MVEASSGARAESWEALYSLWWRVSQFCNFPIYIDQRLQIEMQFTGPNKLAVSVEETRIHSVRALPIRAKQYIPHHSFNLNGLSPIQVAQQIIANNK